MMVKAQGVFCLFPSYERRSCVGAVLKLVGVLAVLVLVREPSRAQDEPPYRMIGSWWIEGDSVHIAYDLFVPIDRFYNVSVILKKDGDSTFAVVPRATNGAIGKVRFEGGTLVVGWDYKKDVPGDLEGKYRFDFVVTEIEEGGLRWWHYAAGGAVLVGGVYAILKSKDETETTLPGPPRIRP